MGLAIRFGVVFFVDVASGAGVTFDGALGIDAVFGVDAAPDVVAALAFTAAVFGGVEVAFGFGVNFTFGFGTGSGFLPSNNISASSAEIRSWGRNRISPPITARRGFNAGSVACLANLSASLDCAGIRASVILPLDSHLCLGKMTVDHTWNVFPLPSGLLLHELPLRLPLGR